jgi:hypothetical protein
VGVGETTLCNMDSAGSPAQLERKEAVHNAGAPPIFLGYTFLWWANGRMSCYQMRQAAGTHTQTLSLKSLCNLVATVTVDVICALDALISTQDTSQVASPILFKLCNSFVCPRFLLGLHRLNLQDVDSTSGSYLHALIGLTCRHLT